MTETTARIQTFKYYQQFLVIIERRETRVGLFLLLVNMKPLLPTLKEKKRYIGFEVLSETQPTKRQIQGALSLGLKSYLGELGLAKAGFSLISLNNSLGIIRVTNKLVNDTKAAMMLIKMVGNQRAIFRSVGTSGTLKGIRKRMYGEVA